MRQGFDYPQRNVEYWTAMRFADRDFEDRNDNYLRVVAKLRPGVTVAEAQSGDAHHFRTSAAAASQKTTSMWA